MNRDRGRVVVVPLWRKEPDIRMIAQAVISYAENQRRRSSVPRETAKAASLQTQAANHD